MHFLRDESCHIAGIDDVDVAFLTVILRRSLTMLHNLRRDFSKKDETIIKRSSCSS